MRADCYSTLPGSNAGSRRRGVDLHFVAVLLPKLGEDADGLAVVLVRQGGGVW